MKGSESKTPMELSDLESSIVLRAERRVTPYEGTAASAEFDERLAREKAVARLRLVWEARRFLGRVAGLGLVFSVAVALLIPNRYQSVARLMPPDSPQGGGLSMALAALSGASAPSSLAGFAGQMLGLKSTSDLLVGVLSSRTVADKLIQKFDLQKVYWDRLLEDTRKDLAARTDVSVDRKSQIITVAVTDKDPQRAEAMAQAYVEELNRVVAEVSTSSARRERIFLEGRLKAVNQDLENAEREFSQFSSKNTTVDIKEQGKAMLTAAATLQGHLIAARSELEGLRQIYADGNVRVRSAQARVAELESQLKKIGGQGEDISAGTVKSSDSIYPSIKKLPLLGVTYADLYRRTKIQETVLEVLTQQYEMAKVQEAKEIPTVKVLDPPNLPDKKSFPPRTLIVALGTMLSFSLGLAWVVGCARWAKTDPSDPRKAFAHEVLASVSAALPWSSRNGAGIKRAEVAKTSDADPQMGRGRQD